MFRLKHVDLDGSFTYSPEVEVEIGVPQKFALHAAYTNPFNPSATITYELPREAQVRLRVFNVLGQHVGGVGVARSLQGEHAFRASDLDGRRAGHIHQARLQEPVPLLVLALDAAETRRHEDKMICRDIAFARFT